MGDVQVVGVDFLGVSSAVAALEVAKRGLPVPQVGRRVRAGSPDSVHPCPQ